ncbi:MAG: hypothetical protein IJQ90_02575 [Alphaproteobacteria bacterium]|nr:hypothetical protein [Alphaproteobacteria bacterium]
MPGFLRKIRIFIIFVVCFACGAARAHAADCNAITLDANGGTAGVVATLYKESGNATLYADSACTTPYTTTSDVIPTRTDYTFLGFFLTQYGDAGNNTWWEAYNFDAVLNNNGAATNYNALWTIDAPTTLYAAWAQNCVEISNGTCELKVTYQDDEWGTDTYVDYLTHCDTGYTVASGPTCTGKCNAIILNANSGTLGTITTLYKKTGDTTLYTDNTCTTQYTTTSDVIPTRNNYTFRGFYEYRYSVALENEVAPNDQVLDTTGAATAYNSSWTVNAPTILYAAWALNCQDNQGENHVTCTLNVSTDGAVGYALTCLPGYNVMYNTDFPLDAFCEFSYAITLDANGGMPGNITTLYTVSGGYWLYTDSDCTTRYSATDDVIPTRNGYRFRGFYVTQYPDARTDDDMKPDIILNNTGAKYSYYPYSAPVYDATSPVTIYAAWAADCPATMVNGSCTLDISTNGAVDYTATCNTGYAWDWTTFNCEPLEYSISYQCGHTQYGNPPDPQTGIRYGASVMPQENTCDRASWTFDGWLVSNTSNDIKQPGTPFVWEYDQDKQFTAQWVNNNIYTITYDCDDGYGTPPPPASFYYSEGVQLAEMTCAKLGYDVFNWKILGTSIGIGAGREVVPWVYWSYGESITLVPNWAPRCNTITFNDNNGTTTSVNANNNKQKKTGDNMWFEEDPNAPGICLKYVPSEALSLAIPQNGDATFSGYYTTCGDDGVQIFDATGAATTYANDTWTISTDTELCAHWQCADGYTWNPTTQICDAREPCTDGQHLAHGECQDNVMRCTAPHASYATRTWNPAMGAYGSCQVQECIDGYHIASNACVLNEGLCAVPNGRGERTWNASTNTWGDCVVTQCDPGFEISDNACAECENRRVNGEIAVSSYASGCEIATCMYHGQKYTLEGNECRPICENKEDHTGSKHWDETSKKCVRTCKPGYKMW